MYFINSLWESILLKQLAAVFFAPVRHIFTAHRCMCMSVYIYGKLSESICINNFYIRISRAHISTPKADLKYFRTTNFLCRNFRKTANLSRLKHNSGIWNFQNASHILNSFLRDSSKYHFKLFFLRIYFKTVTRRQLVQVFISCTDGKWNNPHARVCVRGRERGFIGIPCPSQTIVAQLIPARGDRLLLACFQSEELPEQAPHAK